MPRYLAGPGYRGNPGDTRKEGDPVPEAEQWTDPGVWVRAGHLVEVANDPATSVVDPPPNEPAAPPAPSEPEPPPDDGDNSDTYTTARLNFLRKARLLEIATELEAPVTDGMGKKELVEAILARQNQDS